MDYFVSKCILLGSNFDEIYRALAMSFVREHFTPLSCNLDTLFHQNSRPIISENWRFKCCIYAVAYVLLHICCCKCAVAYVLFYPSFCVPINKSHRFWNKRDCLFSFTTMPFSWKAVKNYNIKLLLRALA